MTPHRETMGALFTAGLAPDSPVAVLGEGVRACGTACGACTSW